MIVKVLGVFILIFVFVLVYNIPETHLRWRRPEMQAPQKDANGEKNKMNSIGFWGKLVVAIVWYAVFRLFTAFAFKYFGMSFPNSSALGFIVACVISFVVYGYWLGKINGKI